MNEAWQNWALLQSKLQGELWKDLSHSENLHKAISGVVICFVRMHWVTSPDTGGIEYSSCTHMWQNKQIFLSKGSRHAHGFDGDLLCHKLNALLLPCMICGMGGFFIYSEQLASLVLHAPIKSNGPYDCRHADVHEVEFLLVNFCVQITNLQRHEEGMQTCGHVVGCALNRTMP
jgi:hypothetical protein